MRRGCLQGRTRGTGQCPVWLQGSLLTVPRGTGPAVGAPKAPRRLHALPGCFLTHIASPIPRALATLDSCFCCFLWVQILQETPSAACRIAGYSWLQPGPRPPRKHRLPHRAPGRGAAGLDPTWTSRPLGSLSLGLKFSWHQGERTRTKAFRSSWGGKPRLCSLISPREATCPALLTRVPCPLSQDQRAASAFWGPLSAHDLGTLQKWQTVMRMSALLSLSVCARESKPFGSASIQVPKMSLALKDLELWDWEFLRESWGVL